MAPPPARRCMCSRRTIMCCVSCRAWVVWHIRIKNVRYAAKSNSKKGIASPITICIGWDTNGQHCQIAGNSCQNITTVLGSKDQPSNTKGKLVGMVRRLYVGTIRSQVLMSRARQRMQFRDLMSVGWLQGNQHKIKSVPTEMWSVRGIQYVCYCVLKESLRGS